MCYLKEYNSINKGFKRMDELDKNILYIEIITSRSPLKKDMHEPADKHIVFFITKGVTECHVLKFT